MLQNPAKEHIVRTMHLFLILSITLISACSQDETSNGKQRTDALESTISTMALSSSEGAKLAKRKCASCHSLDRNIRKVGPTLKGIMGRAPSIEGMPFETWNEETMDKWLENPRAVKKKTRMALPGISDPAVRKAIITYLKLI